MFKPKAAKPEKVVSSPKTTKPENAKGAEVNVGSSNREIPLFSKSTLESNLAALGPELLKVIREEATKFVVENRESVLELSQDVVKAVLVKGAFEKIIVPQIVEGQSLEQSVQIEAYLAVRSEIFSLVASAELKHATRVAELKSKAIGASARVAGVLLALGFKAVVGG